MLSKEGIQRELGIGSNAAVALNSSQTMQQVELIPKASTAVKIAEMYRILCQRQQFTSRGGEDEDGPDLDEKLPDLKSVAQAYRFAESQNAEQSKLITMEIAGGTVENTNVANLFKSQQHPAIPN